MSTIAFLLAPGLHLLDLAGPAQVFFTAASLGYPYRLVYLAEHEQVPTAQGLPLVAATRWPELNRDDLILVPGWRADRSRWASATPAPGATPACSMPAPGDPPEPVGGNVPEPVRGGHLEPDSLARLVEHQRGGGTVASVCAGADALGRAGLLDGRRCTTHHELQEELARRYPRATVVRDVLYVVDDRVVTSAGIASGIDLALYLVATGHGPAAAARVARAMVVYARRNGEARQSSAMLRHRAHLSDVVHRAQDIIDQRFTETLPLGELAAACRVSQRTLTRLFVRSTGMTPLRYQQTLRVERAEHLIGAGTTVESAARATGFSDARMLRRLRARD